LTIVNLVINAAYTSSREERHYAAQFLRVCICLLCATRPRPVFEMRLLSHSTILFLLIRSALTFCTLEVLANQSQASPDDRTITAQILDAIDQNTPGRSAGYPVGVPTSYAWRRGSYKPQGASAPPSDFTAVTGWGAVYPKLGTAAYSNPDRNIVIANAKTYVHLNTTRQWVLVQDQSASGIGGAQFAADFKRTPPLPLKLSTQQDGSVVIGTPPPGYNAHFWIFDRGTYAAGSVDGVYVQMDVKTSDPNKEFVANVGADWWRDASAEFVQSFANNPGAGMSNWVELSTQWSTLRFYSWSTPTFVSDPPPPLAE
jgi:hypothetical protein